MKIFETYYNKPASVRPSAVILPVAASSAPSIWSSNKLTKASKNLLFLQRYSLVRKELQHARGWNVAELEMESSSSAEYSLLSSEVLLTRGELEIFRVPNNKNNIMTWKQLSYLTLNKYRKLLKLSQETRWRIETIAMAWSGSPGSASSLLAWCLSVED